MFIIQGTLPPPPQELYGFDPAATATPENWKRVGGEKPQVVEVLDDDDDLEDTMLQMAIALSTQESQEPQ